MPSYAVGDVIVPVLLPFVAWHFPQFAVGWSTDKEHGHAFAPLKSKTAPKILSKKLSPVYFKTERSARISERAMSATLTNIREAESWGKPRVDLATGVIHGAKMLGRVSKNGREYSDQALDDATRLYEGAVINIDHPNPKDNKPRGFLEGCAVATNVQRKADGVYGDLNTISKHRDTPVLLEWAEKWPDKFGLSHNADGVEINRGGKRIVESLERVISVDVVRNPATVNSIFESEDAMSKATVKKTLRAIIEAEFPKTHKGAGLLEMDGMADLPVEAPAAGDSEDQIWAAFKQAIMSAVDDDKLDIKATLKKIGEILKAYDKLTGSEAEKTETTPPGAEPKTEGEKLKAMLGTLLEQQLSPITKKLAAIEQEAAIRKLCEQFQVTPDAGLLEALTKLPDEAAQKSLLEREAKNHPPAWSKRKPLVESVGGAGGDQTGKFPSDTKSFLAAATGR